jgi:antitoxin component YwqK of YwqJK toxin-antitoxin module
MEFMKVIKFAILAVISILFACSFSCKNGSNVENIDRKDTLPEALKGDTLVEESKVIIVDTFDTGEPMKIHFACKQNNDSVYEKQYYKSGKLFIEGALVSDRRQGKWIAYYEDGKTWSVGYFKDGLKHGSSDVYYENGKLRYVKNYEQDVAVGLWKFYDEQGNLLGEVMYENGKILWQKGTAD